MLTRHGREKFSNLLILLDITFSSTIVMVRLDEKLCLEKYSVMQWHLWARNSTTNYKVKVDFISPTLSATNDAR